MVAPFYLCTIIELCAIIDFCFIIGFLFIDLEIVELPEMTIYALIDLRFAGYLATVKDFMYTKFHGDRRITYEVIDFLS